MHDPYDLQRFVEGQSGAYETALGEIRCGHKAGHWMWFIFPQIAGLGQSAMAQRYAIRDVAEARAYLAHPVLGPHYRDCVAALGDVTDPDAERVFGRVDAVKLRSSLTLFEAAAAEPAFAAAIDRWFAGARDPATLARL